MKELSSKEIKDLELGILIEFNKYCKENKLTYFLCGGTLLGAIRHHGFIPWDDDIDVFMPRPDYERFKSLSVKNPVAYNMITYSYDIPERTINYPFMKVLNTDTKVEEKAINEGTMGIWIDVFPVDGLSSKESELINQYKKNKAQKRSFRLRTNDSSYTSNILKKILCSVVGPILKRMDIIKFCGKMDSFAKKLDYDKCDIVGGLLWGYGPQEAMKKCDLKPIELDFEGHKFIGPSCYDFYLSNLYGDYMTLPPEEKRIIHGFKAYLINE